LFLLINDRAPEKLFTKPWHGGGNEMAATGGFPSFAGARSGDAVARKAVILRSIGGRQATAT
jgi:hypothetical protein